MQDGMESSRENNTVLFVDDEINVISAIRRAVSDETYKSFFASSAREALEMMAERDFSVIVTDMRMPGMDGLSLLKIVKEKYPRTVRVVLSGYTQLSQMLATINLGEIFKFIAKPWTADEDLLPTVRQAIDYYNLHAERDILRENLAQRNAAYQNVFRAMEQKLAEEKKDLRQLKEISGWIFSLWRKHGATAANESEDRLTGLNEFVDVMEETYLTYLSQLPTVEDVRTSAMLIDDIAQNCNNRVIINPVSNLEYRTKGNHKFLLMVFKLLAYYAPQDRKTIIFDLVETRPQAGKIDLKFDLRLIQTDHSSKYQIVCALLNKIGKAYNISVSSDRAEDRSQRIRVLWEAAEA